MRIPVKPPDFTRLIRQVSADRKIEDLLGLDPAPGGKYRHWHTLRFLTPPEGLSHEAWWLAIKLARSLRPLPLKDREGVTFRFCMPDQALEMAQVIDRDASG